MGQLGICENYYDKDLEHEERVGCINWRPVKKETMKTNRHAEIVLSKRLGSLTSDAVIYDLIEAGLLEADPISEPERLANAAEKWLANHGTKNRGTKNVFEKATGWSTESWNVVLSYNDLPAINNPEQQRQVFAALIILKERAGL